MLGNIWAIEQTWMNNVKVTKPKLNGWSIILVFLTPTWLPLQLYNITLYNLEFSNYGIFSFSAVNPIWQKWCIIASLLMSFTLYNPTLCYKFKPQWSSSLRAKSRRTCCCSDMPSKTQQSEVNLHGTWSNGKNTHMAWICVCVCLCLFLLTTSTALRTRSRLSPRAALTSTSLHPLLSSSATKLGTLDTSSRPSGILRETFYFLKLSFFILNQLFFVF